MPEISFHFPHHSLSPSALCPPWNLDHKHLLPIYFYLTMSLFFLPPRTPHPLFLTLPRPVNGESRHIPLTLHHKWRWKSGSVHNLLQLLEGPLAQQSPVALPQKPNHTTYIPPKKDAILLGHDDGISKATYSWKHPCWTTKAKTFFETIRATISLGSCNYNRGPSNI